ncbi:MAG: sigma-70 family RNA polymerase sigma factor [Chthoniobacter sp.]|nr:sigma-70 family RNA polymerase sigma factor [Chthoniobacter sp.]
MDSAEAAACLQRLPQGDEEAAHALFHHLYPLVARLVRSHRPIRTSEEDLCQIAMVKIFSAASQFSGKVPIEHWVSRIVINTCLNQIRSEKVRRELRMSDLSEAEAEIVEKLATATEAPDAADALASRELVDLLLTRLPPKDRLLIQLLHLEGRNLPEVAALTGWNHTVIKVRAFRARRRMRHYLRELEKTTLPRKTNPP